MTSFKNIPGVLRTKKDIDKLVASWHRPPLEGGYAMTTVLGLLSFQERAVMDSVRSDMEQTEKDHAEVRAYQRVTALLAEHVGETGESESLEEVLKRKLAEAARALDAEKRYEELWEQIIKLRKQVRIYEDKEVALSETINHSGHGVTEVRAASPDDIRAMGWSVAVHNDYKIRGVPYTFWLFTKEDRAVKGEGTTDAEALNAVRAALDPNKLKGPGDG